MKKNNDVHPSRTPNLPDIFARDLARRLELDQCKCETPVKDRCYLGVWQCRLCQCNIPEKKVQQMHAELMERQALTLKSSGALD